jgi:hypothetical protein
VTLGDVARLFVSFPSSLLAGRYGACISQTAGGVVIGMVPVKQCRPEGFAVVELESLGRQGHRDSMRLLRLPSLLDAVVDESHEASGHNHTGGICE